MKFFTKKENSKKIITAILIIMLFNLVTPTASHAAFGGKLFKPISQLLRGVADLTMQGLQLVLIGDSGIEYEGNYNFIYSPGLIFSNRVGLDVNFFKPMEDIEIGRINYDQCEQIGITTRALSSNVTNGVQDLYEKSVDRVLSSAGYEEAENSSDIINIIEKIDFNKRLPQFEFNGKKYEILVILTPRGTYKIEVYYYDEESYKKTIYNPSEEVATLDEAKNAFIEWAKTANEFKTSDNNNSELDEKRQKYKDLLTEKVTRVIEKADKSSRY